ncbi:Npun_F0813 family protein [Synechocystis sp. PCC 7509]|uniref:Npun_F0813 family protein n=1 Tax=Synechocystis sp. PCC 7509 TaxID=927677 RepID=UPI0002ABEAB5|nr:Npun_F0813 family protein [Synechocystis sp. PCC 7509]
MFILKRQDVEIFNIKHPTLNQLIPIINYQRQTFRLLQIFPLNQAQEALALWRDLTDNKGKACILLEEPDRYTLWGKIKPEQLNISNKVGEVSHKSLVKGSLLLLQAVYTDIEDLLGTKQANLFQKDFKDFLDKVDLIEKSPEAVNYLLAIDPLSVEQLPVWQEAQLLNLLQETHRLGKRYFGDSEFTKNALDSLEDMSKDEQSGFVQWLNQSSLGKLWQ